MIGTQFLVRTISRLAIFTDELNPNRSISGSPGFSPPVRLTLRMNRSRRSSQSLVIRCRSSSYHDHDHDDGDYIVASLLVSETRRHYQFRRNGYVEEMKWKPYSGNIPFSVQATQPELNSVLGLGILRRFKSPTIFLKISCDGDFLLPITVEEFAVKTLIDVKEYENGDYANEYEFLGNLVDKLGYEVKMVRITERLINNYLARIFFSKRGERGVLSVEALPSDAINVAKRCEAPIYVNKQIVLADAIKLVNGMGRLGDTKPIYDVTLDSPADGPDYLLEELNLMKNMNFSAEEERYTDAATWRDKLMIIRKLGHGV